MSLAASPKCTCPGRSGTASLLRCRDEPGALMGVGRVGGGAHGQFQSQLWVEVSGCEMHVAKDFFCFGGVLGVDVDTDFGFEVRGHLGAAAHELAVWSLAEMAPRKA